MIPATHDSEPQLPQRAPAVKVEDVYDAFLRGRKESTKKAYQRDLAHFAEFLGQQDANVATAGFFSLDAGAAHYQVDQWVNSMKEAGLKATTINRRLSALRSMSRMAAKYGVIQWTLKTQNERMDADDARDMSGPSLEEVKRLFDHCEAKLPTPAAVRNTAIVRLLYAMALRRFEVANIDLEHVDFGAGKLQIVGKGRKNPTEMTMPASVVKALGEWVALRGRDPGPLFLSMDPAKKGTGRLDGSSIRRIVRKLGQEVGLNLWPHGLRHSSITSALDHTDGDVRRVMRFSRHQNVQTLMRYDDKRRDDAGDVAQLVDDGLEDEE